MPRTPCHDLLRLLLKSTGLKFEYEFVAFLLAIFEALIIFLSKLQILLAIIAEIRNIHIFEIVK